jgi:hypothetical protein
LVGPDIRALTCAAASNEKTELLSFDRFLLRHKKSGQSAYAGIAIDIFPAIRAYSTAELGA